MRFLLFAPPSARLWRAAGPLLLALSTAASTALAQQTPERAAAPVVLAASAASAEAGWRLNDISVLAATCANCHGPAGHAPDAIASLYGMSAQRLAQRMREFKAGTAHDATVMTRLMKGYDDRQIEALAQWFGKGGNP